MLNPGGTAHEVKNNKKYAVKCSKHRSNKPLVSGLQLKEVGKQLRAVFWGAMGGHLGPRRQGEIPRIVECLARLRRRSTSNSILSFLGTIQSALLEHSRRNTSNQITV